MSQAGMISANAPATGRITGTATTTGAVTADAVTYDMGSTARVVNFDVQIAGYKPATASAAAAAGFQLFGTVITDGATATVVDTPDLVENVDPLLKTTSAVQNTRATIVASGNDAIIRVIGTAESGGAAENYVIRWRVEAELAWVT